MNSAGFFAYPDSVAPRTAGLLAAFSEDEVTTILGYAQARRYAAGQLAMRHGDVGGDLYIITTGRFEVLVPTPRGVHRTESLGVGHIFGELGFFDSQPCSADVRALEDAEALIITPVGFEHLRVAEPRLAMLFVLELGRILSLRFRDVERRVLALSQL